MIHSFFPNVLYLGFSPIILQLQTDKFTIEATIVVDICKTFAWFYMGCPECSIKLINTDGTYVCHNHGPLNQDPKHM